MCFVNIQDNLFAISQDEIFIISVYNSFCILSISFLSINMFESLANINENTLFETLGWSFI